MVQHNRFREDMLDLEDAASGSDVVSIAGPAADARVEDHSVVFTLPLFACKPGSFEADPAAEGGSVHLRVQSWGGCMVRVRVSFDGESRAALDELDSSPMIERDPGLLPQALTVTAGAADGEYAVRDSSGAVVFRTLPPRPPAHPWSSQLPDPHAVFDAMVCPDGADRGPVHVP